MALRVCNFNNIRFNVFYIIIKIVPIVKYFRWPTYQILVCMQIYYLGVYLKFFIFNIPNALNKDVVSIHKRLCHGANMFWNNLVITRTSYLNSFRLFTCTSSKNLQYCTTLSRYKNHYILNILDQNLYDNAIREIISDTSNFEKLSEGQTLKPETFLQHFLRNLKHKIILNKDEYDKLYPPGSVPMVLLKCTNFPLVKYFLNVCQLFHL